MPEIFNPDYSSVQTVVSLGKAQIFTRFENGNTLIFEPNSESHVGEYQIKIQIIPDQLSNMTTTNELSIKIENKTEKISKIDDQPIE